MNKFYFKIFKHTITHLFNVKIKKTYFLFKYLLIKQLFAKIKKGFTHSWSEKKYNETATNRNLLDSHQSLSLISPKNSIKYLFVL